MCGIVGFWPGNDESGLGDIIKKMNDSIVHRGPDDEGVWIDDNTHLAMGQRRLSIVDLSPAGHQPMISSTGRYVIVFNGEIYNYKDIRKEILDYYSGSFSFKGTSDTEVMLEAFEIFGVELSVKKFVGMFAFALFDRKDKKLFIARDRIGEKPLYYGMIGNTFVFASEMKAIYAFPGFNMRIDRNALALYFRYCYIPAPFTISENIKKLMPGTILVYEGSTQKMTEPVPYWSFEEVAHNGIKEPFKGTETDAVLELEALIKTSISGQMIADVPVGAFLSGGIDSSLVVALMQSLSSKPVKTFTIGFNEQGYNEACEAKKIATHLGTEHTELYINPNEAMSVIYDMPHLYDEPFADSSQIPTFLVSKLARSKVTVSLSGDAGDELFGGYNRYFMTEMIWDRLKLIPSGTRKKMSGLFKKVSVENWDRMYSVVKCCIPSKKRVRLFGDKVHKVSDILYNEDIFDLYNGLASLYKNTDLLVKGSREPEVARDYYRKAAGLPNKELMMFIDSMMFLPDDILAKVDRASMGVSLESRVPFLDHRIVEFAWRLPIDYKIKNRQGKAILRKILYKYVPEELFERPKMGFAVPFGEWLKGPLKDWASELLDEKRIKEEGYLDSEIVKNIWNEHLSGVNNWRSILWSVLMFESWLREYKISSNNYR